METYKRFEIMFSIEKDFGTTVVKNVDINMSEATNGSPFLEEHVNTYNQCNIGSTPFLVKNTPANVVDDILNNTMSPFSQRQSQKNICQSQQNVVSGEYSTKLFLCEDFFFLQYDVSLI